MPAIFSASVMYQVHDEILETTVYYRDPSSLTSINMADLQALAGVTHNAFTGSDLSQYLGTPFTYYGSIARTQKDVAGDKGPAKFVVAGQDQLGFGGPALNEACYFNWVISGANPLGKGVSGGIRLSGIDKNQTDCNTLNNTYRQNVLLELNLIFPAIRTINGQPFARGIFHNSKDFAEELFVLCPSSDLSNRVGIDSTRRGNRSQARGKVLMPPGPQT